ncbi:outer membrane protein with beta-barrel domain [Aquimarina sp. MAR_2010_214]|uniref:porin family protein n=1 Tax=Aquimarina sp. MAR_2010_214 TaxID=1250026 RepID=UPI000C71538D|nr:porin family protein [Aquimarina sp. MAR_2010_214]PKV50201.1 outer membrane protein with beta-barrel domain [Aquimarina sp. MAR_2010_214]
MKQILLPLIATILFCINSFAQDRPLQSALLGFKGGVNFATVSAKNIDNPEFIIDFYVGFAIEAMLTEKFGFQIETVYSRQGFEFEQSPTTKQGVLKIGYIQVPVLAKAYLFEGFNIQGGLQLGFKVHEKASIDLVRSQLDLNTNTSNRFDFQLVSGIEYKFKNGFFIQARYSYGFSEIIDDSEIHNSVLSAGVGFMFY